jgi:hypothetical protein
MAASLFKVSFMHSICISLQASNLILSDTHTAHDFFKPQPVKAATVYYMRFIMHDWSAVKSIEILKNVRAAAGSNSRLVIWEMLVPNACRSADSKTDASLLPPGLDFSTAIDMQVCIFVLYRCWVARCLIEMFL